MRALALTIGEPAGIGCDIALAAWHRRRERKLPAFYLLADPRHVAARAAAIGIDGADRDRHARGGDRPLRHRAPRRCARRDAPPPNPAARTPAAPQSRSPRSGARFATSCEGRASAIVTNPIAKAVLYRAGFSDPGHTEYLARLATGDARRHGDAGDDALVRRAGRRAGDDPRSAARGSRHADRRPDRRDRPDRRARSHARFGIPPRALR